MDALRSRAQSAPPLVQSRKNYELFVLYRTYRTIYDSPRSHPTRHGTEHDEDGRISVLCIYVNALFTPSDCGKLDSIQ